MPKAKRFLVKSPDFSDLLARTDPVIPTKIACFLYRRRYNLSVMPTTNEKIGELISHLRQERGLTQAEFARRLSTSQSAVNRMERGHQNLSLETLGRISDVLNKQLISLGSGAVNLRIEGGHELKGQHHAQNQQERRRRLALRQLAQSRRDTVQKLSADRRSLPHHRSARKHGCEHQVAPRGTISKSAGRPPSSSTGSMLKLPAKLAQS